MSDVYEYPQDLIDFLTEQEAEGNEIFTTHSDDAACWIIKINMDEPWFMIITWYSGDEKFNMVNVTGKAYQRLFKIMKEVEKT